MATTLYANTTILEARSILTVENQKKFELRPVLTRVAGAFMRSANAAIVNLAKIKASVTQTTKAIYNKNKAFTINSSRSNTPSGEQSGTGIDTLTWYEKNFVVTDNSKLFMNNEVDRMTALAVNMWNGEKTFWESLDEDVLVAFLESNKSTINAGDGYDGTLDSGNMEIPEDSYKLDTQLNSVKVFQSGTRTIYECFSEEDHLFQAFQVFAIAHWRNEFNNIRPIITKEFCKFIVG